MSSAESMCEKRAPRCAEIPATPASADAAEQEWTQGSKKAAAMAPAGDAGIDGARAHADGGGGVRPAAACGPGAAHGSAERHSGAERRIRARASRPDGERLGARLPRRLVREDRRDDAGRQVPLVDLGDEARGVDLQSFPCAPRPALHAVHEGKVAGICAADRAVRRVSPSAAAWSASAESRELVRLRSLGGA